MYRDRGIRVNAIAPVGTQTHITDTVTFDGYGASTVTKHFSHSHHLRESS